MAIVVGDRVTCEHYRGILETTGDFKPVTFVVISIEDGIARCRPDSDDRRFRWISAPVHNFELVDPGEPTAEPPADLL